MARDDYKIQKNAKQHGGIIRHVAGLFAAFLCGYLVANVVDLTSCIAWVNQHWVNFQHVDEGAQQVASTAAAVKQADLPKPKFEFYTLLSKDNNAPTPTSRNVALPSTPVEASLNHSQPPQQQAAPPLESAIPQPVSPTTVHLASDSPSPRDAEDLAAISLSKASVPVMESRPIAAVAPTNTMRLATKETYMIQVAAVTRRQDAERLKASLTLKGYGVMIISPTDAKISWYRVVIGPFHSRLDAERAQLNVARSEHIQGVIRKLDV